MSSSGILQGRVDEARYLAIDWGTTNRRIYTMAANGRVLNCERDDHGIASVASDGFAAELTDIRARLGHLPAVAAGMIGSTRGWVEAPYASTPAALADLAKAMIRVDGQDFTIVPGVAWRDRSGCDVMRGEEVQILGAVAAGIAPRTALFCQPGTHNKWITVEDGRIVRFSTAMTGEIFALLRQHSILSEMMSGPVADCPGFRAGVEAGRKGALLTQLFAIRAAVLLGERTREESAAYASGLLIGADVAAQAVAGRTVHLLADPALAALYGVAIAMQGGAIEPVDSQAAFAAGIHRLWELSNA